MNNPQSMLAHAFELQRKRQYEQANLLYDKALILDPDNADGWYYRGLCARAMLRDDLAIEFFKRCLALGHPGNIQHFLGLCFVQMHRETDAICAFQKAIEKQPYEVNLYLLLATTFLSQKRLAEAEKLLFKAINIDPDCYEAYRLLCKIKTFLPTDDIVQTMLARSSTENNESYPLHFALAEIFKAENDYKKYWQHLSRANQLQLTLAKQSMPQVIEHFKFIKSAFNHPIKSPQEQEKQAKITPIFIVGLPRSGTTLIEQLLASHPKIYPGDELPYMRSVVAHRISQETGLPFPQKIESLDDSLLDAIAEEYLSRAARLANGHAFITDKNPENFFALGVILKLFPHAKIIRVQRNPIDVCFSLYNQCVSYAVPYFNDLSAMAEFVLEYQALMAHWDELCEGRIFDINYEDLVRQPNRFAAELFAHCGLEWQSSYLNFYKNNNPVRSLTSLQVRQPIHAKSIGSWKDFQEELSPLLEKLSVSNL